MLTLTATLSNLIAITDSKSNAILAIVTSLIIILCSFLMIKKLKSKSSTIIIGIVTITSISLIAILNSEAISKAFSGEKIISGANNLSTGFDPIPGTTLILEVRPNIDPDTLEEIPVTPNEMASAKSILENRINAIGTLDAPVNIVGKNIEIQIPKLSPIETEKLTSTLTTRAKLTIHSVHRKSRQLANSVAEGEIVPGYTVLPHKVVDQDTKEESFENVLIKRRESLSGKYVKAAFVDARDFSIVNIELTDQGGAMMEEFTRTLTPRLDMIATVLDGKVVNYATLNADYLGKRFVITGLDSKEEADDLVRALRNPLENDLKIVK